jgi:GT2 family glycosyltransferase
MAERAPDARRVSVVTVSWNSARWLDGCLASLAAQQLAPVQVVVVDNGSADDSAGVARRRGAQVIEAGANLGFCRASNLGYRSTHGGSVLFLNPDVVLEPDYLARATAPFEAAPRVGFVAGKLLRFDRRTLDSAGQILARSRRTVERGYGQPDAGQFDEPGPIFSACGAAALYRRAALEDVAPDGEVFDEDFFAFHEDLDLGWRANRMGWRGRYEPSARAYHFRGSTDPAVTGEGPRRARLTTLSDDLAYHAVKNRYLAMIKNDRPGAMLRDLPFILGREALVWGYLALRRPRVGWRVIADRRSRRRARQRRRALRPRWQEAAA